MTISSITTSAKPRNAASIVADMEDDVHREADLARAAYLLLEANSAPILVHTNRLG